MDFIRDYLFFSPHSNCMCGAILLFQKSLNEKKPPKWPFWLSSMNHTWILYIIDVIKYKYFIERIMCSKWVQLKIQIGDALYFFNLLTSLVIFCMPFYRHSSLWSLAYCFHAFCLFSFGFLSVFRCYRFFILDPPPLMLISHLLTHATNSHYDSWIRTCVLPLMTCYTDVTCSDAFRCQQMQIHYWTDNMFQMKTIRNMNRRCTLFYLLDVSQSIWRCAWMK